MGGLILFDVFAAGLGDPSQTPESLACACAALSNMCEVSQRCSEAMLALACIPPLVSLLAHGLEHVRCGACAALLQLCKHGDDEIDREVLRAGAAGSVFSIPSPLTACSSA